MKITTLLQLVLLLQLFFFFLPRIGIAEQEVSSPNILSVKKAVLAGGCFWCLEKDLEQLKGVISTTSGYTGGNIQQPTYENYHDKNTTIKPHTEAVEVTYDPNILTYKSLIEYFVRKIDPTDDGGQFCDRGHSYRPVIFIGSKDEKIISEKILKDVEQTIKKKSAVAIEEQSKFWPAEDYHQDYYKKNPIRYKYYRYSCGRDSRIEEIWGNK